MGESRVAQGQPESVGLSSDRLLRIETAMAGYIQRGELPGGVTLVARGGKVAHLQAQGVMDLASGRPMPSDAILRMRSMTKPVTAVLLLTLYERGLVHLDDPVYQYIPAFRDTPVYAGAASDGSARLEPQATSMTLRHCLTHTAGLPYGDVHDIPALSEAYQRIAGWRTWTSLQRAIEAFAEVPLLYQPGTAWSYSFGLDVIGRIVELVSGMGLESYMRQTLFEPLGMLDAGLSVPEPKRDRLATLYTPGENGSLVDVSDWQPASSLPLVTPGSGLFCTVHDYWRFAQMLCNGGSLGGVRVLSRKTVDLMASNQLPASQLPFLPKDWSHRKGTGMGLSVRVLLDPTAADTAGSVGLFGWGGAAATDFFVDREERMVGIIAPQVWGKVPDLHVNFCNLAHAALND